MSDDTPPAPSGHPADARTPDRPVTFRDVFAVREYRALYLALLVSWVGDYLARAAITVLVYQRTESVLLSAASFAIGYLPWIAGGPLLAALAERYPYRRVMIICDLSRMALVALVAVPHLPVSALLVVVFLAMLAAPPAQAARSALLPLMLGRDRMVVALALNTTTAQAAQVFGYFAGATLAAAVNPRLAIVLAAVGFGLSALLLVSGVRPRPAATSPAQRNHLLRETGQGFKMVFGNPVLAAIGGLAVTLTVFAIVPEGLAAAWAAQGNPDPATRGLHQGMIMAAGPVGWVIGGVLISRFVRPSVRQRLIRPLAVAAPLALVPALTAPPTQVVALLTLLSGVAQGGLLPTLNALFVLALPHGFRARAFAVVQGSMQLAQGGAVLATGLLAERFRVPTVVGWWSVGGVLLMASLAARWPRPGRFEAAIAAAAAASPPESSVTRPSATGSSAAGTSRTGASSTGPSATGSSGPATGPAAGPSPAAGSPARGSSAKGHPAAPPAPAAPNSAPHGHTTGGRPRSTGVTSRTGAAGTLDG
ncbi:MFS transporter [Krasilnikovia cinnamomea]|uniref:MFS transporter n=1 Tax=Krasilnikovia cinnamomea TaxID=349313 RepID=A0A4Q7ZP58_9ACTN|nr:MFS transporter [Krasilnikovia cinnamomea]RZU52494.1 MFS transporter [Krasilnikovia cinnamomea]